MKHLLLIALLSLSQFASAAYETEQDLVILKCDGQIDKFIVNLTSHINPKDMQVLNSKIDIGYKVQVWATPEPEYYLVPKVVGNYVGIEASVEGNSAKYTMSVPQWGNYSWEKQISTFKTALTLKAGFINGNLDVDCQATLEKAKIKQEYL